MSEDRNQRDVGRLAFRHEGQMWNVYLAKTSGMDGAQLLASVQFAFVNNSDERKRQFMAFVQECFADMLQDLVGVRPTFPDPPQNAPEHERGGNA